MTRRITIKAYGDHTKGDFSEAQDFIQAGEYADQLNDNTCYEVHTEVTAEDVQRSIDDALAMADGYLMIEASHTAGKWYDITHLDAYELATKYTAEQLAANANRYLNHGQYRSYGLDH